MIPTMILFGLLFGRWWKTSLIAGTLGWPVLLLADGIIHSPEEGLGAAVLGLINTLAGVASHQLALRLFRAVRDHRRTHSQHHA